MADRTLVHYNGISPEYLKTVGTGLLIGRTLRNTDGLQVVVNKATIDAFSIPLEEAIGARLVNAHGGESEEFEIVGVTKNYHFVTLKKEIEPMLL